MKGGFSMGDITPIVIRFWKTSIIVILRPLCVSLTSNQFLLAVKKVVVKIITGGGTSTGGLAVSKSVIVSSVIGRHQ